MKLSLCILAVLCVCTVGTQGQKTTSKLRIIVAPPCFYKAQAFVDLSETDRTSYVAGLMDGFYASPFFGATDAPVANLTPCTKEMNLKQVSAIITKYVKDHPEDWHLPVSALGHTALDNACPGGLKIIDARN